MCDKNQKRFESLLFNYETTPRTDFRDGEIQSLVATVYQPKLYYCTRPKPRPIKDFHSLIEWRKPVVPFDLYHKPKDVVRTNPRDVQQSYEKPIDLDRDRVQKTRPRLVMTPALHMDDFKHAEDRQRAVSAFYVTSSQEASRMTPTCDGVKAPFPGRPAPANPIRIENLTPPFVSPEWRMESVTWDGKQLRTFSDPTKEFWLRKTPGYQECGTFHFD